MSSDAPRPPLAMASSQPLETSLSASRLPLSSSRNAELPRMQYRSRPVTVAVDPISLVISECISITSAIQKHARSPNSSVSAILGGNPNTIDLGAGSSSSARSRKGHATKHSTDGAADDTGLGSRWGLRGQRGKSMQDNPMISGFGLLRHDLSGVKGNDSVATTTVHFLC